MVSMIPNPHTQTQPPQILNTTQKDQPDQKEPDPHHNGRERFREGRGCDWGGWEMRFDLELLGGKLKWSHNETSNSLTFWSEGSEQG